MVKKTSGVDLERRAHLRAVDLSPPLAGSSLRRPGGGKTPADGAPRRASQRDVHDVARARAEEKADAEVFSTGTPPSAERCAFASAGAGADATRGDARARAASLAILASARMGDGRSRDEDGARRRRERALT